MSYSLQVQVKSVGREGGVCCQRCGRPLANPKSIERRYGPVCWQKIQIELWLDVEVPEVQPTPPALRQYRNPRLKKKLAAVHRTLEEFFFVEVDSKEGRQIETTTIESAVPAEG